ncbi:MAG TPA: hypothetical protein VH619_15830 [Verrucomicrobiae bacterium]|nr:hypothetical protein [Verrucomicrobiae bacterium]
MSNVRSLVFTPSDKAIANETPYPNGGPTFEYDQALNGSGELAGVLSIAPGVIGWPQTQTTGTLSCPISGGVETGVGQANVGGQYQCELCIMQESSLDQALQDKVQLFKDGYVDTINYSPVNFAYVPVSVVWQVQGGVGDGMKLSLQNAEIAYATAPATADDDSNDGAVGYIFLAVDWGKDPWGNEEFLLIFLSMQVSVSAPSCQLTSVEAQFLSGDDALTHAQKFVNGLMTDLGTGEAYFQGAIPDLLYLYDFSENDTTAPLNTIPADALTTGAPPGDSYPNFPRYVNQYDAGGAFDLPERFSVPDPDSSGYTPGGNACGAVSTELMLNANQLADPGVVTVFNNTYQRTIAQLASPNASDGYVPGKATQWLMGRATWDSGVAMPNPGPAYAAFEGYADTSANITALWGQIDALLTQAQPVVVRTSLSEKSSGDGGGHMILLLGKGNSDNIAQLYGTSGDYYIAADPAGHYMASDTQGEWYDTVDHLRVDGEGLNYGGWFAMYPVEKLKQHDLDSRSPSGHRLSAVTIGSPFAGQLQVEGRCPINVLVTDPFGDESGEQANGSLIDNITQATSIPPVVDEEEQGSTSIDSNGPVTIVIENPVAGTYGVSVTGTNAGAYELDWNEVLANGKSLGAGVYTNNIVLGVTQVYAINVLPVGPPALHFAQQPSQLALSWPTNYAGYSLQMTTNLANANSWAPAPDAITVAGGLFNVNIAVTGTRGFFRLSQ